MRQQQGIDEDITHPDLMAPPRRERQGRTESCPLCGMRNALSETELASGYLCEECASEVEG